MIVFGCTAESSEDAQEETISEENLIDDFPFEIPKLKIAKELVGVWDLGDGKKRYEFRADGTYEESGKYLNGPPTESTTEDDYIEYSIKGNWSADDNTITLFYWEDGAANRVSTTYGIYRDVLFLFDGVMVGSADNGTSTDGTYIMKIEHEYWEEIDGEYIVEGVASLDTGTLSGNDFVLEYTWSDWIIDENGNRYVTDEEEDHYSTSAQPAQEYIDTSVSELGIDYLPLLITENNLILRVSEGDTWDEWGYALQK